MPAEKIKQTAIINPATGKEMGYSPLHTVKDLKKMIINARQVQKIWADIPVKKRVKKILTIRNYLVDHADKLAKMISEDNGKLQLDALATEILPSALAVNYYCKNTKKFLKDQKLKSGNIILSFKRSKIIRVPCGIIAILSPWNYPFSIPFYEVIKALLAGNAVILKVASETQQTGLLLKECIEAAQLPDGLFSFINLPGKLAGDALLENGVDKLFFTGSVAVGKKLMSKAAETLTPVSLELGGNDAMIVCDDADPERAAGGAVWAGFQNCGQSCAGVERIYVHEKIYDFFMEKLKQKVQSLRVGIGTDLDNDMGAMTTEKQINTIKQHINEALKKGAYIFAQSNFPEETDLKNFIPATVLTNVNHDMQVMREESFGPVVGVMKVTDIQEAIKLANDSNLGLTGSVWSNDKQKAEKIGRQIQAGVITINDHLMSHGLAETPWGGFKESSLGRTHGRLGFESMTQPQVIINDILPFVKKDLWWHPFNKKLYDGLTEILHFLYGTSPVKRIKALGNLLSILPRIFKK